MDTEQNVVKALCCAWGTTSVRLIRADDQSRISSPILAQTILAYEFAGEQASLYDYAHLVTELHAAINRDVGIAGVDQFYHGVDPTERIAYIQVLAACLAQALTAGALAGLPDPPMPEY